MSNPGGRMSPASPFANFPPWSAIGARKLSLAEYLEKNGIPGIQGIDTRALTKKLRVRGVLNGFISTRGHRAGRGGGARQSWPGLAGVDYVKEVTHQEPFPWDDKDAPERPVSNCRAARTMSSRASPLPPADIPIVAYDYGMKYNILRRLRQHGFKVQVVPATTTAAQALQYKPAGSFFPTGRATRGLDYAVQAVRDLIQTGIADFWHLPGPSDSGPGPWRQDLQTQVRPSRRQSARQRPCHRQGGNHLAKPRVRRGSREPAGRRWRWTASI